MMTPADIAGAFATLGLFGFTLSKLGLTESQEYLLHRAFTSATEGMEISKADRQHMWHMTIQTMQHRLTER